VIDADFVRSVVRTPLREVALLYSVETKFVGRVARTPLWASGLRSSERADGSVMGRLDRRGICPNHGCCGRSRDYLTQAPKAVAGSPPQAIKGPSRKRTRVTDGHACTRRGTGTFTPEKCGG
jgi:hypothetical protein